MSKPQVLIVIGDAAETVDTLYPLYRLIEAGFQPVVAAPEQGRYQMVLHEVKPGWTITKEWEGYSIEATVAFRDVDPDQYVGIFFSGGRAPEYIRYDTDLVRITKSFFAAAKPIGCVCHGVEIPAYADCVRGRRMATVPKCRFDLEVCGGIFVDEPCVIDGNLVSGRTYHDNGHFVGPWIRLLQEQANRSNVREWTFPGFHHRSGGRPLIMGIVNVTPDSFSDGGKYLAADQAVEHALQLINDGADLIDIGGESTRPGAMPVSVDDELRRVIPVIERLVVATPLLLSIDTSKPLVAKRALECGARIVNDISGLPVGSGMVEVCRDHPCGIICMHMQGTPQTMQIDPHYENVVSELTDFFTVRLNELRQAGIPMERVVIDPGIGFGKSAEHNLHILSSISRFHELGRPVLIGHSRKRFLQKVLGQALDEKSLGTVGVSIAMAQQQVEILRVHDVKATRDAITAWQACQPAGGESFNS